ncbi:cation diffusion facilitator family transporter [Streptomyces sp. NPDC058595]|uniref:cation diffusion facilitator family transporter n=1 Tax=Streptomyces sp. NPDC058595 TaxID=3346550 RepID=UPI00364A6BAD
MNQREPDTEKTGTKTPGATTTDAKTSGTGKSGVDDVPDPKKSDGKTRITILVALAANIVIAVAKAIGGLISGSPALLSEAAHSVADSVNEVFLLTALHRSRRPADRRHPFGYGKERYFWSLLAAVGIFVMGGCFSFYQGYHALVTDDGESPSGYTAGLIVLGVALAAEGSSLLRALHQLRKQKGSAKDPAVRTVVAEDATAVLGVLLAMAGMVLHLVTGEVAWEAGASFGIGLLLVFVAYRLGAEARVQLVGESVDPELRGRIASLLDAQPEIDNVAQLLTMRLGMESALIAARIDLVPGLDSEEIELICVRIKRSVAGTWPEADHVFLDITEAPPETPETSQNSRAPQTSGTSRTGGT